MISLAGIMELVVLRAFILCLFARLTTAVFTIPYTYNNRVSNYAPRYASLTQQTNVTVFTQEDLQFYSTFNLSLPYLEFNQRGSTRGGKLQRIALTSNRKILIGGVNQLFRVKWDDSTDKLSTEEGVRFGPYPYQPECSPTINPTSRMEDNRVTIMLFYPPSSQALFVCGTAKCGQCQVVMAENLHQSKLYNKSDELSEVDMVASSQSSVAFLAPFANDQQNHLWLGFAYDHRNDSLNVPFISTRSFQKSGFDYSLNDANASHRSLLRLNPDRRNVSTIDFLNGFSYNGFSYFVFNEKIENKKKTRIGRICQKDKILHSYIEVPLKCEGSNVATAAVLEQTLLRKGGNKYEELKTTSEASLFLAYELDGTGVMCQFDLLSMERKFNNTIYDCSVAHQHSAFIERFHGHSRLCSYTETSDLQRDTCGNNPINYYFEDTEPFEGTTLFKLDNELIDSISMIKVKSQPESNDVRSYFFLSTNLRKLIKLEMGFQKVVPHYVKQLEPSRGNFVKQEVKLDTTNGVLYFLTDHSLQQVPVESCKVYNSCSSCFRSINECVWTKNTQCVSRKDLHGKLPENVCPPQMYDFTPKRGPAAGGTELTFYGHDFGLPEKVDKPEENYPNSYVKIQIGSFECRVTARTNQMIRCTLEFDQTSKVYGNVSVTLDLADKYNVSQRKYAIGGKTALPWEYSFVNPVLQAVHPPYGPLIGGTELLLFGNQLDVGSTASVRIGGEDHGHDCTLIARGPSYMICKTQTVSSTEISKLNPQIELQIDSFKWVVNSGQSYNMTSPEKILGLIDVEKQPIHFDDPLQLMYLKLRSNFDVTLFRDQFEYRPTPLVDVVRYFEAIASGGTELIFSGTNFDSVFYPMLELEYNNNNYPPAYIRCDNIKTQVKCRLPPVKPLNNTSLNEVLSNLTANFQLTLDGLTVNSRYNYPNIDVKPIVFRPDPIFFNFENVKTVSRDNPRIDIQGENLSSEQVYTFVLQSEQSEMNYTYPCNQYIFPENLYDKTTISCNISLSDTEWRDVNKMTMNFTISIGALNQTLGELYLLKSNPNSDVAVAGIILGIIIMLTIITILLYFVWSLRKKNKETKENYEMWPLQEALKLFFNKVFGDNDHYEIMKRMNLIVDEDKLRIEDKIGEGNFGEVYVGFMVGTNGQEEKVAVKTSRQLEQLILREADMMKEFNHRHVMGIRGVSLWNGFPVLLIPYMENRDLHSYVKNSNSNPTMKNIFDFATQIAEGMHYLSSRQFVHRDLAARNCFLDHNLNVKVGDFGLARFFDSDKEYYSMVNDNTVPVRWMALESIETKRFTTKSDVWSYGVLVWELFTRGRTPYGDNVSNNQVVALIHQGYRLPKPNYLPDLVYSILLKCWFVDPEQRPTFETLIYEISNAIRLFFIRRRQAEEEQLRIQNESSFSNCKLNFCEPDVVNRVNSHYDRLVTHWQSESMGNGLNSASQYNPDDDDEVDNISVVEPPNYNEATAFQSDLDLVNGGHYLGTQSLINFPSTSQQI